jgi:hypothetical protein
MPSTGLRAAQLPDRSLTSELLDLFGRPRGESSCACERSDEASLTHALQLLVGKGILDKIGSPGGNVSRLVQAKDVSDEKLTEELYLRVLCRLPTPKERAIVLKHLKGSSSPMTKPAADARLKAAQDITWALLNSREFLFNH